MKRLYTIIHQKGGLINAHQSTCCVTPTLAFCDSYWDGEQFELGQLAEDPLQKLPLAAFRAEFMGKNFGVPSEFLVYEKPPKWTFEHALALTLLHDVLVRPLWGVGKELELMSKIWNAMTDFGVSEAKWYPYWRNQQFVKANPESIKVSFYLNRNRILLVVSNLSSKEVKGLVSLNSSAFVPPLVFTSARDAITGENLILEKGTLWLTLPPIRTKLIRIE